MVRSPLKIPQLIFKHKPSDRDRVEAPLIESSKQTSALAAQKESQQTIANEAKDPGMSLMGGGDIALGGDGTGFPGGVHLSYWQQWMGAWDELKALLGRDIIDGQDRPTVDQMRIRIEVEAAHKANNRARRK